MKTSWLRYRNDFNNMIWPSAISLPGPPSRTGRAHTCPSSKRHTTSRGLKVRSKSELLIAEKLSEHGILFRYEQILEIGVAEKMPKASPSSSPDGAADILGALRSTSRTPLRGPVALAKSASLSLEQGYCRGRIT